MNQHLPQLTLGLSLKDEGIFENFYPGPNIEIIDLLKKAIKGQGEKIIYLQGFEGQGRTHLLHASCHYAHQQHCSSVYLPLADLIQSSSFSKEATEETITPELLNGLETLSVICFDDLQTIVGIKEWEEAVFHLYNRINEQGGSIIMAGAESPKSLSFLLPDLQSRLSWGIVYKLQPLSDQEKLDALIMRAKRRGIQLSEEVGRYLLTHVPRQMNVLFKALNELDLASLSLQRRITIPLVKEILNI